MLIVMDKSAHEEHLSQPLKTKNKQVKKAVTFSTGYNGNFIVTISNYKFYFKKTFSQEDGFFEITKPPGAYEIESLNNEIKRIKTEKEHFTEGTYPFTIKPSFSTLRSPIETSPQRPITSLMSHDCTRNLLGFIARPFN